MLLVGLEEHNYVVDAQTNSAQTNSLNDAVILNTTHTCIFIYPMKMKKFGLSETKLFHWIFNKKKIDKISKAKPLYTYEPLFQKSSIRP